MTDKTIPSGSIQIEKLILVNYEGKEVDILPLVLEFNVFESVLSPFITASFVVTDSLGLSSVWPIIGQEIIQLSFKTPHDSFLKKVTIDLQVVAINDFRATNVRTETFVIQAVSKEMVRSQQTRVRKSYREMTVSDMAKQIFDEFLKVNKELEIENSVGTRTIVIPNMTPSRAMDLLAREAYIDGQSSNYVFFEDNDKFHFKTIDGMIKNKKNSVIDPYYFVDTDIAPEETPRAGAGKGGGASRQSNKPFEFLKILSFEFPNLFNYNTTQISGGLENTVRFLDPISSSYTEKTYNYFDNFSDMERTSKNSPREALKKSNSFILNGTSKVDFLITNQGQTNEYNPDQKPEFWNIDIASKSLLENTNVNVTISGDSEKRAGDIVYLEFPEFGATDDIIGELNRYYSGKYFVNSVRHIYNTDGYVTVLNCSKNAFEKDIESKIK